ncbi:DEAD/DEAH box helicase [Paenibacillus arenilitoris]|uniref:DEAD/DEAH box helicase n=1 Tax=Paenibacillus arenilitoris TaxID=2772299 RepID=A0A927H3C5_9BACL|nr:DEAD/DEAH box helicase [Paenibacillus arenilitoris]MBD2867181.1 DEAD/DEAH box helicase [Paenibacillus arenilitoris]
MNAHMDAIKVEISLTSHGDALLYGFGRDGEPLDGLALKQRLFAWHAPSVYGTELELEQAQGIDLIVLPAELVIPFFAENRLLEHVHWTWGEQAGLVFPLAGALGACIEERSYVPSYRAHREGKLRWTWDESALDASARASLKQADAAFAEGLSAAFSAAVFHRHYGTESAAADLRRDYPLLFSGNPAAMAGMDAQAWLVAAGWRADTAPFRPVLQLLEPEEGATAWRLRLVLQDKRDPAALVPVRLGADGGVSGAWPAAWSPSLDGRAEGWLGRLRACLPRERMSGHREDVLSTPLSGEEAWRFLTEGSAGLLEAGWQVLLPAWWETASRAKPRLRAKVASGAGSGTGDSLFGLDSLVDFDWRVSIGETDLTEEEFAGLVAGSERLVRFRGQWVVLDPALLAQIRKAMAGIDRSQGLSFQDVLQLHLLGSGKDDEEEEPASRAGGHNGRLRLEVELNEHLERIISQLGGHTEWPKLAAPDGLRAELRSYQRDGYAWLAFMRRIGLGACLADDMGLGKTVQLIAYLLHVRQLPARRAAGSASLIICPTSVLGNWQKELARFAPSLRVMLHYGARRLGGDAFRAGLGETDVVLTSYATAALDQELLGRHEWASVSLDEAQNIKNAQTKQSGAVRSLPAKHRIALTGTPIENRLSELWSIYDFMNPNYLGSLTAFTNRFANAIEKERDAERTADLQKLVKPFMLRRKKKDPHIRLDLPEKNEMKTYIHLTAEQGALYNQTVNQLMERMQSLEGIERKGAILSALTRLKQICDHPILAAKEAAEEIAAASEADLDTDRLVSRSSKLERLLAMVKELRDEGDKCLIFTQYVGMGLMMQRVLERELQEPVLYLNGSTSKSARDRMIERFQRTGLPPGEEPGAFILSIKAGGVGLNLTAANHVFHFDRWWNPAVENQATDRAYRMGQTRDVQVHKFIALGTLEERIDEMIDGKQQLSDNVISGSEGWITELSTEALRDLFALRQDWSH